MVELNGGIIMLHGFSLITILLSLFALGFGYIILSQANKEYKIEIKVIGIIIGIIIITVALACLFYFLIISTPQKNRLRINERNIEKVPFKINVISPSSGEATKEKKISTGYSKMRKYHLNKLWEKKK